MKTLLMTTILLLAQNAFAGVISIENPRVRLLPPSAKNTGAFMRIKNSSNQEVKLTSATNEASHITELHTHKMQDGMMKMRQVPFISIPANGHVDLKPGSFHVMLIDLKTALQEGKQVKITLKFDNDEALTINAPIQRIQNQQNHGHHH